ncbi:hypothetical protein SPRG_13338 [Saprolegnia parasitica CBS 223.65]|uniref:Ion transport domain-containing protein n=1 Tax=Saprolegnia parasitica (strain CBS 223.65) TaxID=695850 RepID=A0A067C2J2_SAPPC|nr:hypothetical protein SPRG_13338 [Saprolegnia parasitica CBS 223.65]KDO20756.1 hypothetical protein SPRG_13338 [Saprolegnia parasitica CBS 223.65]|eukprot:XP_012208568.1 hypothetical protein SPRG_13338 [Saprolegnia parasitica CBS 223.65]
MSFTAAASSIVDYGSVQVERKDTDNGVIVAPADEVDYTATDDEDPAEYQDMNMVDLISYGKTEIIKHRLKNGMYTEEDLVATTQRGDSLLTVAASYGNNEIVELVLQRTNYRLIQDYASGPLWDAVASNHKRVVQTLLTTIGHEMDLPSLRNGSADGFITHRATYMWGCNEILEVLLEAGAPVDAVTGNGETALHLAASSGNVRGVEILLKAKANVNAVDDWGRTPLRRAVGVWDNDDDIMAVMELLFIAGAIVHIPDNNNYAVAEVRRARLVAEATFREAFPVHCIARNGDVAKFRSLLPECDADVMRAPQRWEGQYCLDGEWRPVVWTVDVVPVPHEACYRFVGSGADDISPFTVSGKWSGEWMEADAAYVEGNVHTHVEYRGKVDVSTSVWIGDWNTFRDNGIFAMQLPLQRCPTCNENTVLHSDKQCLCCLPDGYNADASEDTIEEQRRRLEGIHQTLSRDIIEQDEDVLQAKIDLKQQYPLYYLARVEDCAQAAAYVQAQQSPIHVAITTQLPISVLSELIYESPQEVNAQDKLGNTPLMVASKLGLLDHVHMLLDNEADVDMTNHHGQSALMMAAMGGHVAIVDSLLEHLADVALRDTNDKTVLDMLQSHITTHLAGRSCHERTKSPFVQIQNAIEKEIRDSKTSTEYRAKLAASLADLTAKTAFDRNGFAKAINCAPELGVTFLNDCVSMDRHDVHFTNLDYVYGKHVSASALHALLHMETDDPDLIFEAKTKCFEHVTIRRILEIKWELFGQRKFLEMLFMYLVLLVSMTISAVLFHDDDTRLDAASVEVLLGVLVVSLAIVGCIAVQALRPQTLWRLARYRYDGSLAFDPELDIPDLWRHKASAKRWLKLGVLIGTLLLAGLLVGLLVVTSSISFFPVFNNLVLAVAVVYFVVNECQEARGDLSAYLASTINVVQVSMYMLILVVFLPMQLNWLDTPDQVEIAVGSGITLTLWILSLQFLEVERNASYLLPMLTGLLKDLWNFFLFFGVFQIGITVTFFQLYKTTDSDDFNSLSGSFLTSYFVAFGQVPMGAMGAFTDEKTKSIDGYDWVLYIFAVGMIMAHSAVVVLFLLNLLVANMNKTVDGGLEKAKTEALAAYAQCILRLEEAMHCSPKETQDLIYFIPPTPSCDGKLNPIFTASMPKSHYGITAEIEAAIATHVAQQTSWVTMAKTIQDQVTAALTTFEDGLLDVAHFIDVDISVVFAKELAAVAVTRSSLDKVFVSMRKSRGQQDQRKLLGRFQKTVARDLMTLGRTLHQIGAVASDDDHARCVIVYKLARQSSMASDIEALQAHASSAFDEAMGAIGDVVCDADGKDSSSAVLAEMQALMEAQNASAAAVIAAMEEKNAAAMATMAAMEGQIEALLHTVETLVVVSAVA